MANIEVKEFKIKLKDKEYTFRLDFKALIKFNNRYDKAMEIFNDFLQGKNVYEAIVKILSCSCTEKDFTDYELSELLSFDYKTMKLMDEVTFSLIEGMIDKSEGSKTKN